MRMLPYLAVVAQQQLKLLQRSFNTGTFLRYSYYHCVRVAFLIISRLHAMSFLFLLSIMARYVGETLLCCTCVEEVALLQINIQQSLMH